jgi:hypothetical protein
VCACVRVSLSLSRKDDDVKYLGLHLDCRLLAQTHFHKMESASNHPYQNVLVTQTQVKALHKQQTSHMQNNSQTNPDLQNTTLVYFFHSEHRNSRTFPIDSFLFMIVDTSWCVPNIVI